jgi:hypothetical protein
MPPNSERRTRSAHSAHMRTATLTRYRDAAQNLRHQHQPSLHARFDTSFSRHTHTLASSVSTLSAPQHPCARQLAPSCSSFVRAAMLHIRTWDRKIRCSDRTLPRDGMSSVQLMRLRMNLQLHPLSKSRVQSREPPSNALDSHHGHVLSVRNRGRDDSQAPTESY